MKVKNAIQIKFGITINAHVSAKIQDKLCEKDYIWNPTKCAFENGECLKSVADDLKIVGDEIIETTKSASTKIVPKKRISKNFNEKKLICKMKTFCILLVFLLIVAALLIVVSICCCIIK